MEVFVEHDLEHTRIRLAMFTLVSHILMRIFYLEELLGLFF